MKIEMEIWEREEGVKFLKKIGMEKGQTVFDFGARVGHYTFPAAITVGEEGLVYAVDKEKKALDELYQKASSFGLKNIRIVHNSGETKIGLEDQSIDFVLLYDVLHYFKKEQRTKLYGEVFRILKTNGLLSVYPKHVLEDCPSDEFGQLHWKDVKREILDSAFVFREKQCGMISHDDSLNQGCILNFNKNRFGLKNK